MGAVAEMQQRHRFPSRLIRRSGYGRVGRLQEHYKKPWRPLYEYVAGVGGKERVVERKFLPSYIFFCFFHRQFVEEKELQIEEKVRNVAAPSCSVFLGF